MKKYLLIIASVIVASSVRQAESQQVPACAPGKVPLCMCACVAPATDACETPPADLPNATQIQSALIQYRITSSPQALWPFIDSALKWSGDTLSSAMVEISVAARCFSKGADGPSDPTSIPASQVKQWVLSVLRSKDVKYQAMIPIVDALTDKQVCTAYRRAVELKRGKVYGFYGDC